MKFIVTMLTLLFIYPLSGQSFFDLADEFFRHNIRDGLVKYDQIVKDPDELNQLVSQIGNYDLKSISEQEKKAFYINAYNLLVIHQIITNYPVEGPLSIPGFFDQNTWNVAGEMLTLDLLEKERLFKNFPDPRLHFVLVCAAMGCPPLAGAAYRPDNLDQQLEERSAFVLNFQDFIIVNEEEVQVSKIFEWYKTDFGTEKLSILSYIDRYHTQHLKDKKLAFYEYDWRLNRY